MSHVALLCPSCQTPARITTAKSYTCPGCRTTTPVQSLTRERRITTAIGGSSGIRLIATIRPPAANPMGDQNDATSEDIESGGVGAEDVTVTHAAAGNVAPCTITHVRFFARASYVFSAAGPSVPTLTPAWRLGAAGTIASGTPGSMPTSQNFIANFSTGNITTDPDGAAWTVTTVNDLRLSAIASTNGNPETTTLAVVEVWAEVWGRG